jgi:hypothetical protein
VVAVRLRSARSALLSLLAVLVMSGGLGWAAGPPEAGSPARGTAHPHAPRTPQAVAPRLAADDHYDPRHAAPPAAPARLARTATVAADLAWRLPVDLAAAGNLGGPAARPSSRAPPVLLT